jgi:hypothetical protein
MPENSHCASEYPLSVNAFASFRLPLSCPIFELPFLNSDTMSANVSQTGNTA